MEKLQKRTVVLFSLMMLCTIGLMCRIYLLTMEDNLQQAATEQSTYRLDIANLRGTVYDCNQEKLTGNDKNRVAAIAPTIESADLLSGVLEEEQRESVFSLLSSGKPFLLSAPKDALWDASGVDLFDVEQRYAKNQMLAHVIGYLDGSGAGISGIEKAFDSYLSNTDAKISVSYPVDALNRVLPGEKNKITDTSQKAKKGVVLTIDERIQKIAETAARKYLDKGAVVVAQVGTCDLKAVVSLPNFSPVDISGALNQKDSPLLNRAFSAYNVGSIFKIIPAAEAVEQGISIEETFQCTGGIEVDGSMFHCFDGQAHGEVNMNQAVAYSCNTYFVQLAQKLGAERLLSITKELGLGKELELAPEMISAAGTLPDERDLFNNKALANFSFGQGRFTATPIQIAGVVNTIASGGMYSQPRLVQGLVDEQMNFVESYDPKQQTRIFHSSTTEQVMQFMRSSVEFGTSKKGKPTFGGAGAKTATAETGLKDGDREIIQAWYAGFYPSENPQYIIVVLAEDGDGGGSSCGPVFKEIADELYRQKLL